MQFRWLGVGGIELRAGDQVILIDPYVTRFPLWRMAVGRVRPNRELIAEKIPHCNFVLVTHPHVDHLMDVPDVVRNTGAVALGSANACRLLAVLGVPAAQIREIDAGDQLTLGNFRVDVLPAGHVTFWGWRPFSGPLPPGLRPPLRARDYRMDLYYSFLISAGGQRLLTDPGICPEDAVAADVLFIHPGRPRPFYESLLPRVRPKVVVPYH